MGTLIHSYGTLNIPKEKQDDFKADVKKVAYHAGLFDRHLVTAMGKKFLLLSFPSFSDNRTYFDYSYYEQDWWEGVSVNFEFYRAKTILRIYK